MKELIKYIAKSLVDEPDQVDVQEIKAQQTLVLELRVAKEDLGKVIGKKRPNRPGHENHSFLRLCQGTEAGHSGNRGIGRKTCRTKRPELPGHNQRASKQF